MHSSVLQESEKMAMTRYRTFDRDHWRCRFPGCNNSATEIAFKILKTGDNAAMVRAHWREMFGETLSIDWINDNIFPADENVVSSCIAHVNRFGVENDSVAVMDILRLVWRRITNLERVYYEHGGCKKNYHGVRSKTARRDLDRRTREGREIESECCHRCDNPL